MEESAFTPGQLYAYEKFWDAISVEKTLYYGGLRKGMAEGIEKGIEKGKAEGIKEVASRLKNLGMDPQSIHKATGLSENEISGL